MKNIIVLFNVIWLMSCGTGQDNTSNTAHEAHDHGHGHASANEHMHQSSFDDLVSRFEDPERAVWQQPEKVFALMGDIQGKTLMEIGAGTGYFSFMAREKGARVIAADIDERFLDFIQAKRDSLGIEPGQMEIRKIPETSPGMRPNEVDLVYMVNVYHHIEGRPEYFARLLQNLKNGGKLMIVDFKKEDTPHGPPTEMRLSPDEVKKELSQAGFNNVEEHSDILPEQYILIAGKS